MVIPAPYDLSPQLQRLYIERYIQFVSTTVCLVSQWIIGAVTGEAGHEIHNYQHYCVRAGGRLVARKGTHLYVQEHHVPAISAQSVGEKAADRGERRLCRVVCECMARRLLASFKRTSFPIYRGSQPSPILSCKIRGVFRIPPRVLSGYQTNLLIPLPSTG